jgi:lipooligosaccharide transport system permease protein
MLLDRPAVAVLEYHLAAYRQVWRGTVFSSFVMPLLLFAGLGMALGSHVDRQNVLGVPYLDFIAPGLLAYTAAQVAMMECGTMVMNNLLWQKMYHVMAAAPPRVSDIVLGHLGYVAVRVLTSTGAFLLVMLAFGAVGSLWALTVPLVALLTGMAFATPALAFTASVSNQVLMSLMFRLGLLPMTIFSGIFFPIDRLPDVLLALAYLTPLWHAGELARAATTGLPAAWPVPAHAAVLMVWMVAGYALARSAFTRQLAV